MADDQEYTLKIIKKVITSYLDENIPNNETGLNILVNQCDDLVYKIASKIYTESGHKVDFYIIHDVINNRIEAKTREKEKVGKKYLELEQEAKRKLYEKNQSQIISDIFSQVKNLINEELEIEVNKITLDSDLAHDLGSDFLDFVELIMRLEEHFEIDFSGTRLDIDSFGNYFVINYSPDDINCTVFQLIDYIGKKLYL